MHPAAAAAADPLTEATRGWVPLEIDHPGVPLPGEQGILQLGIRVSGEELLIDFLILELDRFWSWLAVKDGRGIALHDGEPEWRPLEDVPLHHPADAVKN